MPLTKKNWVKIYIKNKKFGTISFYIGLDIGENLKSN